MHTVTIWADKEKGTSLKIVTKGIDSLNNEYENVEEYTPTYNTVTDDQVAKPDLTTYTKIEY